MLLLRKTFGPFVRPPIKATTRYMFVVYGFTSHSRALREKFYHLFNFFFVQSWGRRGRTDVLSGLRKASLVTIEGQWMRSAFAHTKPFGGRWRWGWWQIRWNIRRWGQTIWPPWPRSPIFHSGTAHHIVLHNVACDKDYYIDGQNTQLIYHLFKRGNAQKGLWAHLAALFLLFLVFEFFSFGPPLETMKKK